MIQNGRTPLQERLLSQFHNSEGMNLNDFFTELKNLLNRYIPPGIIKGSEFLVPPESAVHFAEELSALGAVIYGVNGWNYYDPNDPSQGVIEDLAFNGSIDERIINGENAVANTLQQTVELLHNIPENIAYVSLIDDLPDQIWWKVLGVRE